MHTVQEADLAPRGIDQFYQLVETRLASTDFTEMSPEEVTEAMRKVKKAYLLAKDAHAPQTRDDGERFFNHVRGVAEIILNEFPSPTRREVIAAVLHDVVEDNHLQLATIRDELGEQVAQDVDYVTKKPYDHYLSAEQRQVYSELSSADQQAYITRHKETLKQLQNEDYFKRLGTGPRPALRIKIADRIHNLRSLPQLKDAERIAEQIIETTTYLQPVIQKYTHETLPEDYLTTEAKLLERELARRKIDYFHFHFSDKLAKTLQR